MEKAKLKTVDNSFIYYLSNEGFIHVETQVYTLNALFTVQLIVTLKRNLR